MADQSEGPPSSPSKGASVADLVSLMDKLLSPEGCPWDREQTLESLAPYLIEETYEVLEAIDSGDPGHHQEELGDLLLQIVFQSALRSREGAFDIDDVTRGIVEKMVRRHPHVFGDAKAADADTVLDQWQKLKAQEKGDRRVLDGVPRAMPALARAQKISVRAARVGFDWPDVEGCRAKVDEELRELDDARAHPDAERVEEELGDLLFAIVSMARKLGVDAESALRRTTDKFEHRFRFIEDELRARGKKPADSNLEEMDALWERAKRETDDGAG